MSTPTPPIDLTHLKALEIDSFIRDAISELKDAAEKLDHYANRQSAKRMKDKGGFADNKHNEGQHYPQIQSCIDRCKNIAKHLEKCGNTFPQLCRELEESKSYVFQQANIITKTLLERDVSRRELATLQSQLSKAEEERDRMRKVMQTVFDEVDQYADGAPDASGHDKMCLWVSGELWNEVDHSKSESQPLPQTEGREDCNLPPAGWRCTRTAGHSGPCAAEPVTTLPPAPVSEKGGQSA